MDSSRSRYLCFRPLSRVQSSKNGEENEDEKQDQSVDMRRWQNE
jgi:hypothetical protein